jgi:hypothetical protein
VQGVQIIACVRERTRAMQEMVLGLVRLTGLEILRIVRIFPSEAPARGGDERIACVSTELDCGMTRPGFRAIES